MRVDFLIWFSQQVFFCIKAFADLLAARNVYCLLLWCEFWEKMCIYMWQEQNDGFASLGSCDKILLNIRKLQDQIKKRLASMQKVIFWTLFNDCSARWRHSYCSKCVITQLLFEEYTFSNQIMTNGSPKVLLGPNMPLWASTGHRLSHLENNRFCDFASALFYMFFFSFINIFSIITVWLGLSFVK